MGSSAVGGVALGPAPARAVPVRAAPDLVPVRPRWALPGAGASGSMAEAWRAKPPGACPWPASGRRGRTGPQLRPRARRSTRRYRYSVERLTPESVAGDVRAAIRCIRVPKCRRLKFLPAGVPIIAFHVRDKEAGLCKPWGRKPICRIGMAAFFSARVVRPVCS